MVLGTGISWADEVRSMGIVSGMDSFMDLSAIFEYISTIFTECLENR